MKPRKVPNKLNLGFLAPSELQQVWQNQSEWNSDDFTSRKVPIDNLKAEMEVFWLGKSMRSSVEEVFWPIKNLSSYNLKDSTSYTNVRGIVELCTKRLLAITNFMEKIPSIVYSETEVEIQVRGEIIRNRKIFRFSHDHLSKAGELYRRYCKQDKFSQVKSCPKKTGCEKSNMFCWKRLIDFDNWSNFFWQHSSLFSPYQISDPEKNNRIKIKYSATNKGLPIDIFIEGIKLLVLKNYKIGPPQNLKVKGSFGSCDLSKNGCRAEETIRFSKDNRSPDSLINTSKEEIRPGSLSQNEVIIKIIFFTFSAD